MGNGRQTVVGLWMAFFLSAVSALGDGRIFTPPVYPVVEIPNQQALISFANGRECLVVETSFLAEGTNFAWVVPLPAAPDINYVSPDFFPGLRKIFEPELVHDVAPYYRGVLFLCGLFFLGWRSLKDEKSWVIDLPLCILMAAVAGFLSKSYTLAVIVLLATLYVRLLTRSPASLAMSMLVGVGCIMTGFLFGNAGSLVMTMGGTEGSAAMRDVTIISRQQAGVFDATTIQSDKPQALIQWLEDNGFNVPEAASGVIKQYVERGWVFVAAKVRRDSGANTITALHPLSFTFSTPGPIYPMQLTGVENSDCSVDLYVFGERRARARYFKATRCDRVEIPSNTNKKEPWKHKLRVNNQILQDCIGNAVIGTKLSATLSPRQMKSDVKIKWTLNLSKGDKVYSQKGAASVALNVLVVVALLSWFTVGACRGGWDVDDAFIWRWRLRLLLASVVFGMLVYWYLPKVEIVIGREYSLGFIESNGLHPTRDCSRKLDCSPI